MRIPDWLRRRLLSRALRTMARRAPDQTIGGTAKPYLQRWYLLPRNPLANLYLHRVLRSDDDRALHDHPWWNLSLLLHGAYLEVVPQAPDLFYRFGDRRTQGLLRAEGELVLRRARAAHRLVLLDERPVITLFLTGPRFRRWGFWCKPGTAGTRRGWRHWKDFVAPGDKGAIGRGCG